MALDAHARLLSRHRAWHTGDRLNAASVPPPAPTTASEAVESLTFSIPSAAGAGVVYAYFSFADPAGPTLGNDPRDLATFALLSLTLIVASSMIARRAARPILAWAHALRAGAADATAVPERIRRQVLNAPLGSAVMTLIGWAIGGIFYFAQLRWRGVPAEAAWRVFAGVAVIGGPVASALSFLTAEFYWRQRVPLFYPAGQLDRAGVVRVPVLARLGATFLVTAVLPPVLILLVTVGLIDRTGATAAGPLAVLLRTQLYIVTVTSVVSVTMALLVARFINRPVQALRAGMARVGGGDLSTGVPVRSTDELGDLAEGFNAMLLGLRDAERARELFGRYVSPAVARQALQRGIAFGGEAAHATAMFADLRGFTALTQRTPAARVVELLNEYYGIVEDVCGHHHGTVTQFLGDGIVVVFGGPLQPLVDHAASAVRAAVELQRRLAARNRHDRDPLAAGIGICTGEMVAGNVGASGRVTYTIVGDAVNQAARLQVKTRDLGRPILITASTRAALGAAEREFHLQPCGALPLKGIAALVEVFAVDDGDGTDTPAGGTPRG